MTTELHQPSQAEQIASLPPDMAILKIEQDSIQSLAAARPRNFALIKEELAAQLEAFPAMAQEAVYAKPVGWKDAECRQCGAQIKRGKNQPPPKKCPNGKCKSENIDPGGQQYARNLSIRSAEAIAEVYGFNRVRVDVTTLDADTVKVEATFTDYQRGRVWQDAGIVSKWFRTRGGQMQKISDDRFYNVVVKAEGSKRVREVIMRSVSPGLKAWYWDEVEKQIDTLLDEGAVQKIVAEFANKGVERKQLEAFIGRPMKAGWTKEDRKNLLGVWNAIKDGETTVADVFGHAPRKGDQDAGNGANGEGEQQGAGPVSGSDLTKPKEAAQQEGAEEPQGNHLLGLLDDLAHATKLSDVNRIETGAKSILAGDEIAEFKAACKRRREEIRAKKGRGKPKGTKSDGGKSLYEEEDDQSGI